MSGWTWAVSLGIHAGLAAVVTVAAIRSLHSRDEEDKQRAALASAGVPTPIDLPPVAVGTASSEVLVDRFGDVPVVTGGTAIARLDTGRDGHGGDETSAVAATHLSDRNEALHLSPDDVSHLDRDQIQRIRSATTRASWEDRRSTTNPMELTFIATGTGDRQERRAPSATDPSRGAMKSADAARLGGRLGDTQREAGDDPQRDPGSQVQGTTHGAPGTGVHGSAAGDDHRASAIVAFVRPDVTQGSVFIPATDHARPKDDVDSSQAVAKTLRSIVHGSYTGGAAGDGNGGSGGGGAPGAGGQSGEGSHPPPLGLGEGELYDLETSDPRLLPYFRKLHAKIEPLWQNAFPRSAMLELKQGTVILEFDIAEDGAATVRWPPLRPSGIDEFDRNCADAIRKAAPFEPIPAVLGVKHLRVRAPFIASNPIVK